MVKLFEIYEICREPINQNVLLFYLVEWGLISKEGEYFCSRKECRELENPLPVKLDKHTEDMWRWRCCNYVSVNKKKENVR